MKIIRFPDANKTDIIDANEKTIDRIDAWRTNGNPNIEVTLYAYLPPLFFDDAHERCQSDGSHTDPSSVVCSEVDPKSLLTEQQREPSDIFEEDEDR